MRRARSLLPLALLCAGWPGDGDREPRRVSFRYDVLPLLQRQGCASAYCHGSATGRGGFKLSLFGSDPDGDHFALTRELDGRRIDLTDPERSLLLMKPSTGMEHGGGRRLPRTGEAYATLRAWIAEGARIDPEGAPALAELAVERHGDRVAVRATFTAGGAFETRDVTALSMLSSSDDDVVAVDGAGQLEERGPGAAWIFARYGHLDARLRVVRPFPGAVETPAPPAAHALDRAWLAELAELGLAPAPPAPPARWLRRLHLDLVGRPPTPKELEAFEREPAAGRQDRAAARLLADPAFAQVWGEHLARWLEIDPSAADRPPPRRALDERLERELVADLRRGATLTEIARELLLRRRELLTRLPDPRDRAELVGRAFLGIRLGCARCHDHPLDRWRRAEHLAFSAFFTDPRPGAGGGAMAAAGDGVLYDPETGARVEPALPALGQRLTERAGASRDERVASFVLDPDHGRFCRNMANRVLGVLLGRGPVWPADDHRPSNPARHGAMLDAAAAELARSGGDLRALLRWIVSSRLYALDSEPAPGDAARARYLARREARPMGRVALRRSVEAVLGVEVPPSLELPASPLALQLALLNGDLLHGTLGPDAAAARGRTRVDAIAELESSPAARLRALYRLVLSRDPSPRERAELLPHAGGGSEALRELAFALLASREFGSIR